MNNFLDAIFPKPMRYNLIRMGLFTAITAILTSLSIMPALGQEEEEEEPDWDAMEADIPEFAPAASNTGLYLGPSFELSSLTLDDLDTELDGTLILGGASFYVLLDGWMLGTSFASGSMLDLSSNYDEFSLSYGGLLTGYDWLASKSFSVRGAVNLGRGELSMIKKRPDLSGLGTNEFLERFRDEDFFFLRPEISIGYSVFRFIELRLASSFLYPIGGENVDDLQQFTYGLHVMFGFRTGNLF